MTSSLTIVAKDGFTLSATHFQPAALPASSESPSRTSAPFVIIAPATGTTQGFYKSFASFLAANNLPTFTFDYRFTGASFPIGLDFTNKEKRIEAIKEASATRLDHEWAWDLEAIVSEGVARAEKEGRELVVLAHSLGGHILPLISGSLLDKISRALFVAVCSPWHGHYPSPGERRRDVAGLLEAANRLGYFPSAEGGLGTEVPYACGTQWTHWMEHENYWAHDHSAKLEQFAIDTLSLSFDDDWITIGNVNQIDSILDCLPASKRIRLHISPKTEDWPEVNHVSGFRKAHRDGFWVILLAWLKEGSVANVGARRVLERGEKARAHSKL